MQLIYSGSLRLPVDILCMNAHIYYNVDVTFPVTVQIKVYNVVEPLCSSVFWHSCKI